MIWRRRRAAAPVPPEAPLWDHLDACNIPFRAPLSEWVDRFNLTPSVWSQGLDYCVALDATPLFPAMDVALRAQLSETTDLAGCPNLLWGAVQSVGDHRLNYARAIAGLTKLFGAGSETSASNTVAREWRFGHARLSCTVWPPHKQQPGRNDRHRLFPKTIEEASIAIQPAWRPSLSTTEVQAIQTAKPFWKDPAPTDYVAVSRFTRDLPDEGRALAQGLAVSDAGDLLVVRARGLVDIFPRSLLASLQLDRMTAGRGGCGAYLSVRYACQRRDGPGTRSREIASIGGETAGLDGVAQTLAATLALPLATHTGHSDYHTGPKL